MKIYTNQTVYAAALDRIRWLFGEFPNVVCSVSGGKDSTVVFQLTKQVARELGRLPLRVLFIDQEAEWAATVEQIRVIMEDPDVEPMWFQIPIKLFNATSNKEHWLYCWDPTAEDKWMRPQESYSRKENVYGTDRFGDIFGAILAKEFPGTPTCFIGGVRTEESPTRFVGLTSFATYKWVTWGKKIDARRGYYTFYPCYDWSYTDVWKAIHDNRWPYNSVYDVMYSHGIPVKDMRVSNLHHETAVKSLYYLQEVEPETYARLTQRIHGIDTAGKLCADFFPTELPPMFRSWREYRDFLIEKLISQPEWRAKFHKEFARLQLVYGGTEVEEKMHKVQVTSVLTSDWEFIKLNNWELGPTQHGVRQALKGRHWPDGSRPNQG